MRLLLDEDIQRDLLVRLLREAGHDVLTVNEAQLRSFSDAQVFERAKLEQRVILTRNVEDFNELHQADPRHYGILVEYQSRNKQKNMAVSDIVRAVNNIEASDRDLYGQFEGINSWCYPAVE